MKKTIRPIISKKHTTPSKNTRSSKVKCSSHGSVYCREPCNVNLGENCSGIYPCSSKEDHRTNQPKNHTNINEMFNTNVYKSTHMNYINHKKESQKLSRPSKVADLDQSVDMIPIKLKQHGYIIDKVASVKDDDSTKSAQNIKRTTWDCILRDQNPHLIQTKSMLRQDNFVPNSKSLSNHSEIKETSEYLKKSKLNKSNNDNELILNQCNYRCCLHNKLSTVNDKTDSHIRNKQNPLNPCLSSDQQIGINFDSNKSLFLSTDPAKALDLLVKELRGKLQRDTDGDLQRIILDMEKALSTLPSPFESGDKKGINIPQPEDFKKIIKKNSHIGDCKSVEDLHFKLEQNCEFLQGVYEQLHSTNKKHKQEKERITLSLVESRKLLEISKSKEKDYEMTINELKLKLHDKDSKIDSHIQAIHDLTQVVTRLQKESKNVGSLQASQIKLNAKYHEVVAENEKINTQLQLVNMEKEKLIILMEVKTNELKKIKKDFEEIKTMFGKQLINLEVEKENLNLDSSLSSLFDKESEDQFRPICSSPTSSIPGSSPSPYGSWQVISSIAQKPKATIDLKQGIKDLFNDMKKQTKELDPSKLLPSPASYRSGISDSNERDDP